MSNYFISDTNNVPTVFNTSGLDINFEISGVSGGSPKYLFFDASTGRLGVNTKLPDSVLHIVGPCANDGLKIEGTTNCPTGVRLVLLHNPGTSPETSSYPATIDLAGRDDNSSFINYAQIRSKILNPTTSLTSGEIQFRVDYSGTLSDIFRANTSNVVLGGNNSISGHSYNVVGANNNLSGLLYINLGSNNNGTIHSGLLLGNNISVDSDDVVCVSNDADAKGDKLVLFGNKVHLTGNNSIVIANSAHVRSDNSIVIGNDINLSNNSNNNTLVLHNGNISGLSGIGFGSWVMVTGHNNLFFGHNVRITGSNNSIVGSFSSVTGSSNAAFGNNTNISGSNVISLGLRNNLSSVTSGMFIGHDISLRDSDKTIIMGLNNTSNRELDSSILIGIDNTTSQGQADDIVMIGQSNIVSDIKNSLVIGNKNNTSGTTNNNIIIGPSNFTSTSSNNNVIIGGLNNNSGLSINTQGTVDGTPARATTLLNNSNIVGINNLSSSLINGSIFGNKNSVSGTNINSFGSFNTFSGASNLQTIGNSNFIVGNDNNIFGSSSTLIGSHSIVSNTSSNRVFLFGSGNLLLGNSTPMVSGISVGNNNRLFGANNIVYGHGNMVGQVSHKATIVTSQIIIAGDVTSIYRPGQKILIAVYNPVNSNNIFIRTIGTEPGDIVYFNGDNPSTTINITEDINIAGSTYSHRNNFDTDPNAVTGIVEAYVYPYEIFDTDQILKTFGTNNIVIGRNNSALYNNNLIIGRNINVSGIGNVVIGNNISGSFNNSLSIGTNNTNRIYLDDINVVFNTGLLQENIIFRSRTGANLNNIAAIFNLSNNRLGINNGNPRSSVDVSGTITTSGLRVGLSAVPGHSLFADSNGNATWQFPVNLSGTNSGLLYKVNDKVASGSDVLVYNNTSKQLQYIYDVLPDVPDGEIVKHPGVIFSPSELIINSTSDTTDNTRYGLKIFGSGIGAELNDQNQVIFGDISQRKVLLQTDFASNSLRFWNFSGVSGLTRSQTITDTLYVPANLTGTFLKVRNSLLTTVTTESSCLLYSDNMSQQTGSQALKFFSNTNTLGIGGSGLIFNTNTYSSNQMYDVVLGFNATHGSIFNRAGSSNQPFSIYNSGQSDTRLGLHYSTRFGVLGIGVQENAANFSISGGAGQLSWQNLGASLFVNGTLRAHGFRLLLDGAQAPTNPVNTNEYQDTFNSYLRINRDGIVKPGPVDLSAQFTGTWPIVVSTAGGAAVTSFLSATRDRTSTDIIPNGSLLVYDGAGWTNSARGLTLLQGNLPSSNMGVFIGQNTQARANALDSIVLAGGSFLSNDLSRSYDGSNQVARYFLKTRTIGIDNSQNANELNNVLAEFFINWTKNANVTTPNTTQINYISLDSYSTIDGTQSRNDIGVWNYTINFCGLASDAANETTPGNWTAAVAGKVEGAFIFNPGSSSVTLLGGAPTITFRTTSGQSSLWNSENPPILVEPFITTSPRRLRIRARGRANWNILWNCSVEIHQLNHVPSLGVGGGL